MATGCTAATTARRSVRQRVHLDDPAATDDPARTWIDLVELLDAPDRRAHRPPRAVVHPRRDPRFLRRNALVALGNGGDDAARGSQTLQRFCDGDDELLAEHASWARRRIGRAGGRGPLVTHLLVTNDFPPKIGGIQSYLWELWRRLPPDDVVVYTTAYDGSGRVGERFRVVRIRTPCIAADPRRPGIGQSTGRRDRGRHRPARPGPAPGSHRSPAPPTLRRDPPRGRGDHAGAAPRCQGGARAGTALSRSGDIGRGVRTRGGAAMRRFATAIDRDPARGRHRTIPTPRYGSQSRGPATVRARTRSPRRLHRQPAGAAQGDGRADPAPGPSSGGVTPTFGS